MKRNGRYALLLLLLGFASCSSTSYYVVRHAERLNQTDDSPLSPAGLLRAETLADTLSDNQIRRIFVSDKRRTQETAAPTAALCDIQPIVIPSTETAQLIQQLKSVNGQTVLVARHREEIHQIVNALSPADRIDPIPDEFDNLFVISRRVFLWQRQISLRRLKYGAP